MQLTEFYKNIFSSLEGRSVLFLNNEWLIHWITFFFLNHFESANRNWEQGITDSLTNCHHISSFSHSLSDVGFWGGFEHYPIITHAMQNLFCLGQPTAPQSCSNNAAIAQLTASALRFNHVTLSGKGNKFQKHSHHPLCISIKCAYAKSSRAVCFEVCATHALVIGVKRC